MTGKILRFDEVRGYGFIAPNDRGDDVFMHANDLLDEKYLYQPGRDVEFFLEMGDKGPKASEIRLIHESSSHKLTRGAAPYDADGPDEMLPERAPVSMTDSHEDSADDACDVLSAAELRSELTELLISVDGTLTADQIKRARGQIIELARSHGWVDA